MLGIDSWNYILNIFFVEYQQPKMLGIFLYVLVHVPNSAAAHQKRLNWSQFNLSYYRFYSEFIDRIYRLINKNQ